MLKAASLVRQQSGNRQASGPQIERIKGCL